MPPAAVCLQLKTQFSSERVTPTVPGCPTDPDSPRPRLHPPSVPGGLSPHPAPTMQAQHQNLGALLDVSLNSFPLSWPPPLPPLNLCICVPSVSSGLSAPPLPLPARRFSPGPPQ